MIRAIVLTALTLAVLLIAAGCTGTTTSKESTPVTPGPVPGTWIEVEGDADTIRIPLGTIQEYVNTHFSLQMNGERLDYMAYLLDGTLHIRANVCPPCRSRGFALDGEVLVCDACATTFDASDGSGIEGACVDYPKAAVAYEMGDETIAVSVNGLVKAFEETVIPG
ncbi:MAG: Fe-S-containing protein [Chloroflexota bacterium]